MTNIRNYLQIIVISLGVVLPSVSNAQGSDNPYKLNTFLGLGYNRFVSDLEHDGLNKNGFNGTVRFMWQPEHLLRIGLESGYIRLYSVDIKNLDTEFGETDLAADLTAVPILIVYAMEITKYIDISAGAGGYLLYSTVDSHGNKVESSEFSTGFMVSLSYLTGINHNINIGGEIKWDYINKISDGSILFQFVFKYKLLEW